MKTNNPINQISSISRIEFEACRLLRSKYKTNKNTYNLKVINDIIYNKKNRLSALFRENLIPHGNSVLVMRYYPKVDSIIYTTKYIKDYNPHLKLFPKHIALAENRFLYRSIMNKQKLIDNFYRMKYEEDEKRKNFFLHNIINKKKKLEKFFDSEIINSLVKCKPSLCYSYSCNNKSHNSHYSIYNDSAIFSLNFNKNIIDNEDSSIETIFNLIDVDKDKKKQTEYIKSERKASTSSHTEVFDRNYFGGIINTNLNKNSKLNKNQLFISETDKQGIKTADDNSVDNFPTKISKPESISTSISPEVKLKEHPANKKFSLKNLNLNERRLSILKIINIKEPESERTLFKTRKNIFNDIISQSNARNNSNHLPTINPSESNSIKINSKDEHNRNHQGKRFNSDNIESSNKANYNSKNRVFRFDIIDNNNSLNANQQFDPNSNLISPDSVGRNYSVSKRSKSKNISNVVKPENMKNNEGMYSNQNDLSHSAKKKDVIENNEPYNKVLKIFNEKKKKTNKQNKKFLDSLPSNNTIIVQESRDSTNTQSDYNIGISNSSSNRLATLETENKVRSKLKMDIFKNFLAKKFECLSSRNVNEINYTRHNQILNPKIIKSNITKLVHKTNFKSDNDARLFSSYKSINQIVKINDQNFNKFSNYKFKKTELKMIK